uniref:Uncharacterized protein n=1 Tax=viral metagenome TaxID=1070528 RepID=A0A6C0H9K5_9ZZZZ
MGKNVDGLGRIGLFYFVTFLFIVKILFAILAVVHIYLKRTGKEDSQIDQFISFWKERLEFVFIIGVSLLLMIFFFPGRKIEMEPTFEMRFLFFVYGIIILINLDWKIFVGESPFLETVQKVV